MSAGFRKPHEIPSCSHKNQTPSSGNSILGKGESQMVRALVSKPVGAPVRYLYGAGNFPKSTQLSDMGI